MKLLKAKAIAKDVAAERKRWGKLGGFGAYHADDVLDALVELHDAGVLEKDATELSKALTKSNRQKAAALAREQGAKKEAANLREMVHELEQRLSAYEEI
jgi:hypothetical protein